jgi:hypothetical protein
MSALVSWRLHAPTGHFAARRVPLALMWEMIAAYE